MAESRKSGDGDTGETMPPNEEQSWRGCSLQEIYRNLNEFELEHVLPVRVADSHTVLYHCPIRYIPDNEPPRPLKAHPKWDSLHVRLPCSGKSQYPVTHADGSSTIESRWEMIEKALLRPISNSRELQSAILSYNTKYEKQWNFHALHQLFEDELDESESRVFFEDLLPRIIRLALQLPLLIQAPIPLLKQGHNHSLTLSQQQISCLLANAFLCTFPRRNTLKQKSEYSTFPDINFNRLFQSGGHANVMEKIKCICHYFRRVCPTERDSANVPSGVVTFTRRSLRQGDFPDWSTNNIPLGITPLHITSEGTIEDQGLGLLQVDFANKFLGGGVLGHGCVQEEIRFVICPELLVSKLFTECMRPNEALVMIGCERFSNYSGYSSSFQWAGNHEDGTPRDSSRRIMTNLVAIDALLFHDPKLQLREELMLRELNKSYVGFIHELETSAPGVASGNWGCGAFGGEARLKALLQLMSCTEAKRPLVYYTFGDSELRDDVHRMHTFFIEHNVRVRDLWNVLRKFKAKRAPLKELYGFIYKSLQHGWKPLQTLKMICCSSKTVVSVAAAQSRTKSPVSKKDDDSPDIFASSSDTENENAVATPTTVKSSISNSHMPVVTTHATLSDESESDELLVSTVSSYEASLKNKIPAPIEEHNDQKSPSKKPTGSRQRTLLEMLDQCYTEGSPATKRHCVKKSTNQD